MNKLALSCTLLAASVSAHAAIIPFDVIGTAGFGLLPGNETPAVTGGTGGEIGAGIFFDDLGTLNDGGVLTINIGWGSAQGFTNMTGLITNQHIHGPTTNPFGNNGVGNYRQTAGVPAGFGLTPTTNTLSGGTIVNAQIAFNALQEAQLMNGQFYVNLHTAANGGGEVRGFLIPVPEPSTAALTGAGLLGLLGRRRRA